MAKHRLGHLGAWAIAAAVGLVPTFASAQGPRGYETPSVGVLPATEAKTRGLETEQKTGAFLPMELQFTTAEGKTVRLGELFDLDGGTLREGVRRPRPVIVALVYYDCPVVCSATMDKIAGAMRRLPYRVGTDYKVAFFSFDSSETPARAKEVKDKYLVGHPEGLLGNGTFNPLVSQNWHFMTGTAGANRELANALGFKYRQADNGEFAHSSVFMIITPDGRISRYLSPFLGDDERLADQTRLALLEASDGKIATGITELLMAWCFMYDPNAGAYTLQAVRVMKIGGVLSILGVGAMVGGLLVMERIQRRRRERVGEVGAIPT